MPDKPRGRPPLVAGDIPAKVYVTVPSQQYDKAHEIAKREGVSVPEVMRRGLQRMIADEAASN